MPQYHSSTSEFAILGSNLTDSDWRAFEDMSRGGQKAEHEHPCDGIIFCWAESLEREAGPAVNMNSPGETLIRRSLCELKSESLYRLFYFKLVYRYTNVRS